MMAFLPLILRVLAILSVVGALYGLWYKADHWENSAYREAAAERDEARAAIKIAQDRATALALLWANNVDKFDAALRAAQEKNRAKFSAFEDRARRAAGARVVAVAPASTGVWDDAARSANGGEAPTPSGEREERPSVPGPAEAYISEAELNLFIARAAAAYKAVNDARLACIAIYEATE